MRKPKAIKKIPITEHEYQVQVIDWANLMAKGKYPMLRWLYAVPNGARTARSVANRLKAEGMKAGVPDLCLPYPIKSAGLYDNKPEFIKCPGLYIEMKSKDTKGRVKPEQQEWIDYLRSVGYKVGVAWNSKEAIEALEDYLNG